MDLGPYLKFLDISASSAAIVLLGLSPILYINRTVLLSTTGLEVGFGLGGVVIIFGIAAAVLVVRSGQFLLQVFEYVGRKEIERRKLAHQRDAEIEEIQKNLRTLTRLQKAQLIWILERESERVDLPVDHGLISKGILKSINHSLRLVEVDSWVWRNREKILEGEPSTKNDNVFPQIRDSWMR
jgi:hypothetical protein